MIARLQSTKLTVTMKRLLILLFFSLILPVSANDLFQSKPSATLFSNDSASQSQEDFLPAEQAFRLEKKQIDNQNVQLQFIIADGYYLYKDRFSFASDNPKVIINKPTMPSGQVKYDDYFGKVEAYQAVVDIDVPIDNPDDLAFNLEVTFQGCAEKGLCYPMQTAVIAVDGAPSIDVSTLADKTSETEMPEGALVTISWATLFYYFGFGLLLSLTPCVFPMLPILAGVVLRGQIGRIRAIILAMVYILSMALTYAILGVLVGLFGAELGLQARLQSPWVLVPFAVFFIVFALAMFGIFELRLPAFITNALNKASDKTHGGSLLGAAVLGVCSSLVVSPCVSAPFAGILLHISSTGDAVGGGISLFTLGLGMGLPLLIIAAGGTILLPKAGMWMVVVRNAIGVMLLAVAIYLLSRIVPGHIILALWGLLAAGIAIFIGTFDFSSTKTKGEKLAQLLGMFLVVYAICAWVGALQGNIDPLQSLKNNTAVNLSLERSALKWQVANNEAELNKLLAQAKLENKVAMVDWTADWCVACVKMEHDVFQDQAVISRLADYQLIRVDLSNMTDQHRQLQNKYKVFGPPTILFFDGLGHELKKSRIVGEISKKEFLNYLAKIDVKKE